MKLHPWTPNNIEAQWAETRQMILGEIGRLFGMPAHLLNDTEKQTSWGTGVAEQNLGLARYTLRGWSDRLEQTLSRRLPSGEFCEFDYKGLLQGTPAQEIELIIAQVDAGLLTLDEARKILNLPPLTPAQKAEMAPPPAPAPVRPSEPDADEGASRASRFVRLQDPQTVVNVTTPDVHVTTPPVTIERGAFEMSAPVTIEPAVVNVTTPEVRNEITVEPSPVSVSNEPASVVVNVPEQLAPEVVVNVPEQRAAEVFVTVPDQPAPVVNVTNPDTIRIASMPTRQTRRAVTKRDAQGQIAETTDIEEDAP
jgi:hypothetical protein